VESEESPSRLGPRERATLAALGNVLIPASAVMPSVSEVSMDGNWIDRVLATRPDLEDHLVGILAREVDEDPETTVARLYCEAPQEFHTLALVVSGAYYITATVRQLLGAPPESDRGDVLRCDRGTQSEDFADTYAIEEEDSLLDAVIRRGPQGYRRTSDDGEPL
jgi:hypothetical protein